MLADCFIIVDCFIDWPAVSPWITAPTPFSWSGHYASHFATLLFLTLFGQTEDPSSRPTCSISFLNISTRDSYTTLSTKWWKSGSDGKIHEKIIRVSWTGRSLNHDKFCRALLQYKNILSQRDGLSPAQKLCVNLSKCYQPFLDLNRGLRESASEASFFLPFIHSVVKLFTISLVLSLCRHGFSLI